MRVSRRPSASNRHSASLSAWREKRAKLTPCPSHVGHSGCAEPFQSSTPCCVIALFIALFSLSLWIFGKLSRELDQPAHGNREPVGTVRDLVAHLVESLLEEEEVYQSAKGNGVGGHGADTLRGRRAAPEEMVGRLAPPLLHRAPAPPGAARTGGAPRRP